MRTSCVQHEVSRSRFIGQCFPVSAEVDALSILDNVRKEYWDARHHCFAYRIGSRASVARYSDDGEPSGTAGMPIMQVLVQRGLTDVLCVVTRYFGGTLLGTGGLVRAYTKACGDAVSACGTVSVEPCSRYVLTVSYPMWNVLQSFLTARSTVESTEYTDAVTCSLYVKRDDAASFLHDLCQKSDAQATPQWVGDGYESFPDTEEIRQ